MKVEPATILVIELASVAFFLLLLPLAVVLARLRRVWEADRRTGLVLGTVVVLTGLFFVLFLAGLVAPATAGDK